MAYRILVVDDSEQDVFFFKRALLATGLDVDLESINDSAKAVDLVKKGEFDCVFMDYHMPGADGLDILRELRKANVKTPVVMLTGQKDEKTIIRLMQEGATDYLSKDTMSSEALRMSIENARKLYLIQKEKKLAEDALRNSETRLAEAQKIGHIGNWEYDFMEESFFLSDEAIRLTEAYKNDKMVLLNFTRKVHPKDLPLFKQTLKDLKHKHSFDLTIRFVLWNGQEKSLHMKGRLIQGSRAVGTIQDVTVLKSALLEMQKAGIKTKATKIVLVIAVVIFLLSEAVLDPFIDSLTASLLISLSFKGSIAMGLKPIESLLERIMMSRMNTQLIA